MKNDTLLSLSIQREIEKHPLNVESDIATSMARLGFQTLLNRSGICKQKGCPPFSLLFALLLVPFLKETVRALWVSRHCSRILSAQKDTVYRFLNHYGFNWRKLILLLVNRVLTKIDSSPFNDRVLIVDDSVLPKTGKEMELVSFHHDHKTNRSQLGYQMLQLGYHNKTHFFPVDVAFHTSKNRTNTTERSLDKRCNGWKRRAETFRKKPAVLLEMLQRCYNNGIDARFVLFDSWFFYDDLVAKILEIGYGVICRLKATKTRYTYQDKNWTLKQLWHEVARYRLEIVPGWNIKASVLNVNLPSCGTVRLVFVRWSKKQWHCFLCTETEMAPEEILNYYARRWAIEVYFRDAKQFLALGEGQSECFDALIAWTSMVMIRYILLVYILSRRQGTGASLAPIFQQVAQQHLELAVMPVLIERIRQVFMMSSQLFPDGSQTENFLYMLDLIDAAIYQKPNQTCAKL
jgi:hypothetical protein